MKSTIPYVLVCLVFLALTGCSLRHPLQTSSIDDPLPYTKGDKIIVSTDPDEVDRNTVGTTTINEINTVEMEKPKKEIATNNRMRADAIRDVAQLIAIQSSMKHRYESLVKEVEKYAYLLDSAFNFVPILMTQNEALIMPPVITESGASFRIENATVATSALTSYEILEGAKYISTPPHWRTYLMMDSFPEPEKPHPAVLPKTQAEFEVWQKAFNLAWEEGVRQADDLFIINLSRLVRDYKGIMHYHILAAKRLVTDVKTASSKATTNISKNKMSLKQKVFRITTPSRFSAPKE